MHETPRHGTVANTDAVRGALAVPDAAELARHFPQLQILELLGKGGMGAVYKARQIKLDRLVALKVLPVEASRDPAFAERFMREARALARLNHPNIVTIYDFGEANGIYYFLMEFVDGANLRQLMNSGELSDEQPLKIIQQVCEALQFAHQQDIVHRDIKPENILVDRHGRTKIADFGLAKLVGLTPSYLTLTGSHQIMGTLYYMAPEQMERPQSVDRRADIYSLGVVLYEMLTGELPLGRFAIPSQKVRSDPRLDAMILRALARDPEERYQAVSELKQAIDGIAPGLPMAIPMGPASGPGASRLVGLRFSSRAYAGFGQAVGMIHFDGAGLQIEFIVKDSMGGLLKSKRKEVRIPISDIAAIAVSNGWFKKAVVITASRLGALGDIPGAEHGQVSLQIARKDAKAAELLVSMVIQRAFCNAAAGGVPAQQSSGVASFDLEMLRLELQAPAAGLLVSAIAGLVGYVLLFTLIPIPHPGLFPTPGTESIAERFPGFMAVAAGLALLMACGALCMSRFRSYQLAMIATILAMVPWSPVWPFSLPMGICALSVLRRPAIKAAFAHSANPSSITAMRIPTEASQAAIAPQGKGAIGRVASFFRSMGRYCFDTMGGGGRSYAGSDEAREPHAMTTLPPADEQAPRG
jgi:predicted Ser/Thr protein kinase